MKSLVMGMNAETLMKSSFIRTRNMIKLKFNNKVVSIINILRYSTTQMHLHTHVLASRVRTCI